MNVLFVSNDPSIFIESSATRARMREYTKAISGELHILSAGARAEVVEGNLFLHGFRSLRLFRPFILKSRARALILAHDIAVVSAQDPFEHGWAAMKAVEGTKAKLHIQIHTDFLSPWFVGATAPRAPKVPVSRLNRFRVRLADRVLPRADGIRVVSQRIKDSLTKRYGARVKEATIIPIALTTEVPPPVELPAHPFKFVFMAIGRLEPEKRVEDILNALARVHLRYPSAGLMVVGAGREEGKLKRYAKQLDIAKSVMFLGARSDAWGLLQRASAFVQASAYEGYGLTLIEAALAKVPIITTDVGIVGEVFVGYTDVLATPPGDPANIAMGMVGMMEDAQARGLMTRSAEEKARAHLAAYPNQPQLIANDFARLLS